MEPPRLLASPLVLAPLRTPPAAGPTLRDLRGGAVRPLLVGSARKEVPGLILAALEHKARQQDPKIVAAAQEACAEETGTTASAEPTPTSAPTSAPRSCDEGGGSR
jgi:hypothetical protein